MFLAAVIANPIDGEPRHVKKAVLLKRMQQVFVRRLLTQQCNKEFWSDFRQLWLHHHISPRVSLEELNNLARRHIGMRWILLPLGNEAHNCISKFVNEWAPFFPSSSEFTTTTTSTEKTPYMFPSMKPIAIVKPGEWGSEQRGVLSVYTLHELTQLLHWWNDALEKQNWSKWSQYIVVQLYHPGPWELRLTVRRKSLHHKKLSVQRCVAWKAESLQHHSLSSTSLSSQRQMEKTIVVPNTDHYIRWDDVSPLCVARILFLVEHSCPQFCVGTIDVRMTSLQTGHDDFRILEINGGLGQTLRMYNKPFRWTRYIEDGIDWFVRTAPLASSQYFPSSPRRLKKLIQRLAKEINWVKQSHKFEQLAANFQDFVGKRWQVPHGRTSGPL
jgi:hypothetical protein